MRHSAYRIARRAWPSRTPRRGASSSVSRSRDGSDAAGRPGTAYGRSAITGMVHARHRRAQGPRGRPDRRCHREDHRRGREAAATTRTTSSSCAPRLADRVPRFVRLFDRAVGLIPKLEPRELDGRCDRSARCRRDVPAPRPAARRTSRRRRPRARRGAQPRSRRHGAAGDEADVGRCSDRRPLDRVGHEHPRAGRLGDAFVSCWSGRFQLDGRRTASRTRAYRVAEIDGPRPLVLPGLLRWLLTLLACSGC